jgi:hypothetical protein
VDLMSPSGGAPAPTTTTSTNTSTPTTPEYVFHGTRGRCNVCNIEFTSKTHAETHLAGAKHQKARQRWSPLDSALGGGQVRGLLLLLSKLLNLSCMCVYDLETVVQP